MTGFLAPYRVRRVCLSADAHGWAPTSGQMELFGKEIPAGLYTTSQFERVVSLAAYLEHVAHAVRTLFPTPGELRIQCRSRVGRHDVRTR